MSLNKFFNKKQFIDEFYNESNKRMKVWWDTFEKESDRSIAIVAASLLDNLLEEIIKTFYVKDSNVAFLFRNEQLLMTFYSKINIAYYSGYIPKVIYHDLKIICRIRNKFAHSLLTDLDFNEKTVAKLIQECELRPKTLDDVFETRLKYTLIVQQVADHLILMNSLAKKVRPPKFVEAFDMEKRDFSEATLTKSKIEAIIEKNKSKLKKEKRFEQ